MKVLLEKGYDMNQVTGVNGWCVLHTAAENDYIELAKWLLEMGARTGCTNAIGMEYVGGSTAAWGRTSKANS